MRKCDDTLQDDFYDYVDGECRDSCIPDDKPSTGGFMDLIEIMKTWCWILPENGNGE